MSTTTRPVAWALSTLIVGVMAVDPFGFAPFGPLKWLLVTASAFVALWLAAGSKLSVHRASLWGWMAFLGWGAVIGLTAVDPVHTWIGTPDRRLGLVTVIGFAAVFFASQRLGGPDLMLLGRAFTVGLWIVAVSVATELSGAVPTPFDFPGSRLGGPFGTPAYLGAALVLFIPIALAMSESLGHRLWTWAARSGAIIGILILLGTQTRGALIGVAAAIAVAYPAWSRWATAHRLSIAAGAVIVAIVVISTGLGPRLVDAVNFTDGAAAGRVAEWSTGVSAVATSPVYGSGFEGYRVVFPQVVSGDYVVAYGREFATDRAHNGLIDVTIWTGLVGAAFYLAAAWFLLRRAWQAAQQGDAWLAGFGAAATGYLVQQQFLFPLAEVDGAFWVVAGVLVAYTQPTGPAITIPRPTRYLALVLAAAIATFGVTDLLADHQVKQASIENLSRYERAVDLRPESIRYRLLAANSNVGADPDLALFHLAQARSTSPGDPILAIRAAELFTDRAVRTGVATDLDAAVAAWREVAANDPNHPTVQLSLGVAEVMVGHEPAAEAAWKLAERLAPTQPEPIRNLAILYRSQGRVAEAADAERRAFDLETILGKKE